MAKKKWYEVRKTLPGIHGNTGLPLVKGGQHLLDPKLVGGEEGNDLFKPIAGPTKKEDPSPAGTEKKGEGKEVKDA